MTDTLTGRATARADEAGDSIGAAITIRDGVKAYGAFRAAERISLNVKPGEFVTLLGPSGSGKTTFLNLLAGFQSLDSGEILINGRPVHNVPTHRRGFGIVFQRYALFPHTSVEQNVALPMRMARVSWTTSDHRVAETLKMMPLSEHARKAPSGLSGGRQQRVAIARAIVMRPRVVLMDEPLSALNRRLRKSIQIELRNLHRTIGSTMFVGESNLIEAGVKGASGAMRTLRRRSGHVFKAPSRPGVTSGKLIVLVRPERLAVQDAAHSGAVAATVISVLFTGETLRIEAVTDGGETLLLRI